MGGAAILDTSWLLELYRVPGHFSKSRTNRVRDRTAELIDAKYELFATVPVLFEVANHITHVRSGQRRRSISEKFLDDIKRSIDRDSPWTIAVANRDILIRASDLVHLARKFLQSSGQNYSFADISIIDLAKALDMPGRTIETLTFDHQLGAYSVLASRIHLIFCVIARNRRNRMGTST